MIELSPSHYRTAFEYASDAIFLHDPDDGRIIEANLTSERLTGFSRAELLGQVVTIISPKRPAFSMEEAFRRIRRATT
ncbi:MAG: PAS domain S-box protein, partial [Zavarzinia sp.]|nr:PAS domain S-box protein [Zavarzinia sp.]